MADLEPLRATRIVKCHRTPRAYVVDDDGQTHRALNFNEWVDILHIPPIQGGDGAPIIVDGGCDYEFEIPYEPWAWDLNTVVGEDGVERVVEHHLLVRCPKCDGPADHLTEVVAEPYEFLYQGVDRRVRANMNNPELLELLAEIKDDERRERMRQIILNGGVSGGAGYPYSHTTESAVALVAATPKTVIGAKAGSAVGLGHIGYRISFDGVTASAVPVQVEIGYCTWATNSPGTNSTATTERQRLGRVITADYTAAKNWTTEPTTITAPEEYLLSPNGGLVLYDAPLGTEDDCAVSEGFVIRCTAAAAVNVRATQKVGHV